MQHGRAIQLPLDKQPQRHGAAIGTMQGLRPRLQTCGVRDACLIATGADPAVPSLTWPKAAALAT